MKKSIAIVLGLASLAACTKSSVSYEQTDQISFAPIASVNKTKAAVSGTTFPTANLMGVYAYYKNVDAGSNSTAFESPDNYLAQATFKLNGATWAGWDKQSDAHNPYYWPKTGSLIFAAYSPEEPALTHSFSVADGAVNDSFTANDYVQTSDLSKTVDLLWSPVTSVSYDKTSGAGGVPMTFYHAMSWVTVKAVAENSDADGKFKVKSVKLLSVVGKGNLKTTGNAIAWTPSTVDADANNLAVYSLAAGKEVTTTAAVLEDNAQGTVVIPQALDNVQLEVVFSQQAATGAWTADQTITLPLKDCKSGTTTISSWENAKHYIYTLAFGYDTTDEITIKPDVANWEDVTVNNVSVK